jgi:hypothetical protein
MESLNFGIIHTICVTINVSFLSLTDYENRGAVGPFSDDTVYV